jgi:hypothetical protein
MALKPFVESDSDIPAGLESHYSLDEESGRYLLQVAPSDGFALENVAGLKSTLGKFKERAQNAEGALQTFQALEMNAEELSTALGELNALRESQGNESEQVTALKQSIENLKQQAKAEVDKATAPIKSKLDARTRQLEQVAIVNELQKAIVEEGGNPTLLIPALMPQVKAKEMDDGSIRPVVIDKDGTERISINGTEMGNLSFSELVAEIKEKPEYAPAFSASNASGGGINGSVNNNTRGKLTAEQAGRLSMAEYRKAVEENRI